MEYTKVELEEILDNTLFRDGYEVIGLKRQLLRAGMNDDEARQFIQQWAAKRGYKFESTEVIVVDD